MNRTYSKNVELIAGLAVIALIAAAVVFFIRWAASSGDDTPKSGETAEVLTDYLRPFSSLEFPEFEDVSSLPESALVMFGLSACVDSTTDFSEFDYNAEKGVLYISGEYMENMVKLYFGSSIKVSHGSLGTIEYDEDSGRYAVPSGGIPPVYYAKVSDFTEYEDGEIVADLYFYLVDNIYISENDTQGEGEGEVPDGFLSPMIPDRRAHIYLERCSGHYVIQACIYY